MNREKELHWKQHKKHVLQTQKSKTDRTQTHLIISTSNYFYQNRKYWTVDEVYQVAQSENLSIICTQYKKMTFQHAEKCCCLFSLLTRYEANVWVFSFILNDYVKDLFFMLFSFLINFLSLPLEIIISKIIYHQIV